MSLDVCHGQSIALLSVQRNVCVHQGTPHVLLCQIKAFIQGLSVSFLRLPRHEQSKAASRPSSRIDETCPPLAYTVRTLVTGIENIHILVVARTKFQLYLLTLTTNSSVKHLSDLRRINRV